MAFSNLHAPPVTSAFWAALVAHVDTVAVQALTRGAGRVYLEGDYDEPPAERYWGRLVIVPIETLWPVVWLPGSPVSVPFLVRADWPATREPGYDTSREMQAVHRLVFEQLQGWAPAGLDGVQVAMPVYLHRRWQDRARYTEDDGTLYLSAEYRCQLASA